MQLELLDVAEIVKITHVAEIVKLSHVAEIVKLTHVARILEAASMYDPCVHQVIEFSYVEIFRI